MQKSASIQARAGLSASATNWPTVVREEKVREQTEVESLLHVPGETRLFAGLNNGDLVSVDLASGEIGSRAALGDSVGFLCLF